MYAQDSVIELAVDKTKTNNNNERTQSYHSLSPIILSLFFSLCFSLSRSLSDYYLSPIIPLSFSLSYYSPLSLLLVSLLLFSLSLSARVSWCVCPEITQWL